MTSTLLSAVQERLAIQTSGRVTAPVFKLQEVKNKVDDDEWPCCIKEKTPMPKLMNALKFQTFRKLDDFVNLLQEYIESFRPNTQRKRKFTGENCSVLPPNVSHIVEPYVIHALKNCLSQKLYWSHTSFMVLVEKELITVRSYELMFQCIFKHRCFDALKFYIGKEKKFDEKYILQCIKFIVREVTQDNISNLLSITETQDYRSISTDCPVDKQVSSNLLTVLSLPFDEIILKNQLKLLTADESLVLFYFLHYCLTIVSPALVNANAVQLVNISEQKLMSWIDCLLSAKLTVFISSPSLQRLCLILKNTMEAQEVFYQGISGLSYYLNQLKSKLTVSTNKIGYYKIETITL